MTITTNARITCPDYLLASEPTSMGELLHAVIDSGLFSGAGLTIMLLLLAQSAPCAGQLSARTTYTSLCARGGLTKQELNAAINGVKLVMRNRGFFLLQRPGEIRRVGGDGEYIDFCFTSTHAIWDAARKAQSKLVDYDVPDPEWEE